MNIPVNLKNHIALTIGNDIAHICAPLFEALGLTHFGFQRNYADGGRIYLGNRSEYLEHYLKKGFHSGITERAPSFYKSAFILWDQIDKNTLPRMDIAIGQKYFDIDHGITITKTYKHYVDIYHLATKRDNIHINNVYLSNMRIIEKFIYYFMIDAREIINKSEKCKIFLPFDVKTFFESDNLGLQSNQKLDSFYNTLEIENLLIKLSDKDVFLSHRETECLIHTIKGKTAKEFARILKLSPRTIECYLNNIKKKTNCHSRSILIKEVLNNNTISNFLLER